MVNGVNDLYPYKNWLSSYRKSTREVPNMQFVQICSLVTGPAKIIALSW